MENVRLFFLYDKLRTYGAFAIRNRYVLPKYKNVENVQIRIKFEFENFGSDKTVLWKTYVTYGGNAKERKSTYRKCIFFIRNCTLSVKRTSRSVPFLLINYELMLRLRY